jgi:hypothetical protein
MDELVNQVARRTELAPEQARQAVQTVLKVLKERLPAPIASQIDAVVGGGGGGGQNPLRGLGGILGR